MVNGVDDEPQGQTLERPPLREITPDELREILQAHRKWVESGGRDGKKADLSQANLREANLEKAQLSQSNLHRANLEKAILKKANLQEAFLKDANLREAFLGEANLKRAHLLDANMQGAHLLDANLQGAVLWRVNLEGAALGGANLRHADLIDANMQEAYLHEADLRQASLAKVNLRNANLLRATLREAELQDADLTGATGLLAGQIAGANVSGAKLPPDIHKFEGLAIVEQASKSTSKIFLAMLSACAYSALTIFSTTDAGLLTNSASSPLPIIGTPIPIAGFFVVAPAIILGIYIYFHLYLQPLWENLADLPAVFPDGRPLDKRAYPWLLNRLVRANLALLRNERPPISRLQALVSILLAWWAVPFTIALFWLRYLPRHDWIGTGLHLAFLVFAFVCGVWFQRLARNTLQGQVPEPVYFARNWASLDTLKGLLKRTYKLGTIAAIVLTSTLGVSYWSINGEQLGKEVLPSCWFFPGWLKEAASPMDLKHFIPQLLPCLGFRAFAYLDKQDVSSKPPNWFLRDDKELLRIVNGASLQFSDLRNASVANAFLVKADMTCAQLQWAFLVGSALQGANLFCADLEGTQLDGANLQGADFRGAFNLEPAQVKAAKNWQLAFYSEDFLKKLGLPQDHNERLTRKLAELEKKEKATAAKP
ncbi:MAG: pentapeptide repeat-containing protein [Terriglobia bacterium]